MSITALGSLTLRAALPGALAAALAGQDGIGLALPDIQARLTALAQFSPSLGDFTADIALTAAIKTAIEGAIAVGVTPPSLAAQIAIVAALVADLNAALLSINAKLSIIVNLLGLLATGGVYGYVYSGRTDQMGSELATELANGFPGGLPSDSAHAIVLGTASGAAWTAMSSVFKVS